MKVFKKIMKTLWAIALTALFVAMIYEIVWEIQFSIENDWYSWDIWFIATMSFFTVVAGGWAVLTWYETWLKQIIDKDREHTYAQLIERFDALPKQRKNDMLYMKTFNELRYRERKKILEEILEELE